MQRLGLGQSRVASHHPRDASPSYLCDLSRLDDLSLDKRHRRRPDRTQNTQLDSMMSDDQRFMVRLGFQTDDTWQIMAVGPNRRSCWCLPSLVDANETDSSKYLE